MKRGFNLFKAKGHLEHLKVPPFLPPKYIEFSNYFQLGENSIQHEYYILAGTTFKIPLTNAVYQKGQLALYVETLFSPGEIQSILDAGEKLEDYFEKEQ